MYRWFVLLLLLMSASGCTSTYGISRPAGQIPPPPLLPEASALVSVPENGRYGETVYDNSGAATAQAVETALSRYLARVERAPAVESSAAGFARAVEGSFRYFVEPTILHWEDRATEWSGKPDVISVKIMIYDTATHSVLDCATIDGTSKWATLGGDHPQDLLREPLATYAAQVFSSGAKSRDNSPRGTR